MNDHVDNVPLISPAQLTQAGLLPFRQGPVRFAVGPPHGVTSNSWRIWTTKQADIYIACRDNMKEAKVSLHASGRWRMGFTTEALAKNSSLLPCEQNRAWEVWDKPPASLPKTIVAFRLVFPTSELAVRPEQRKRQQWKDVVYIEAAPPGKLTVVTVFVSGDEVLLTHESEPSFCLASLDLGNGRFATVVAHGEPEGNLPTKIQQSVAAAKSQAESKGIELTKDTYGYFLGRLPDGSRYLVGARVNPISSTS